MQIRLYLQPLGLPSFSNVNRLRCTLLALTVKQPTDYYVLLSLNFKVVAFGSRYTNRFYVVVFHHYASVKLCSHQRLTFPQSVY